MNRMYEGLEASILAGRALHAYLITGADPDVTDTFARNAAAVTLFGKREPALLPDCPDYMEYTGAVSISVFRDIIRPEIYRESYGKRGRAVVFRNAHQLSEPVQNAMLKVLEEPPRGTRFFLTGIEHGILPTVRSRCMIIRCSAGELEDICLMLEGLGADRSKAERIANMSGCITARAKRLYEDADFAAMREGVLAAFIAALNGAPAFKWAKAKYDRPDHFEANEFLLLACHDLMRSACGMKPEFCTDKAAELEKLGSRFTIGEISCIIDELTENAERLSTNASPAAAFDRLFARLGAMGLNKAESRAKRCR